MSQSPRLEDVVKGAIEEHVTGMWSATIGRIVSFDRHRRCADVQPVIKMEYTSESGDRTLESLPMIPRVPVIFPGSRKYGMTIPLEVNDVVLLVFTSQSIAKWKEHGVVGGELDPGDARRHHLGDAVAFPGIFDLTYVPSAPTQSNDFMTIGSTDGLAPAIRIDVKERMVRLGAPSNVSTTDSSRVVVQSALDDFVNALTVANAALTSGGGFGATLTPVLAALKTALTTATLGFPWSSGTNFVKAF